MVDGTPRRVSVRADGARGGARGGDEVEVACVDIDAEHHYSAAIRADGALVTWGSNAFGKLGLGRTAKDLPAIGTPARVRLSGARGGAAARATGGADGEEGASGGGGGGAGGDGGVDEREGGEGAEHPELDDGGGAVVVCVSLGSLYAGAVTADGAVFTWGYGGHGNLGHGDRRSRATPKRVCGGALAGAAAAATDGRGNDASGGDGGAAARPEPVVAVACTRGQDGCKGGLNPKEGGHEGPHTLIVGASVCGLCRAGRSAVGWREE